VEDVYFEDKEGKPSLCEETLVERRSEAGLWCWVKEGKTEKFLKVKTKGWFLNIKCRSGQCKGGASSPGKCHLHADSKRYAFPDDQWL